MKLKHFLADISKLTSEDAVISMVGGSQYAIFSTVQHPEPFDFYEPDGVRVPLPEATIIPFQAVYELVRTSALEGIDDGHTKIKGDASALKAMRSATRARLVHVLPPPPVRDGDAIQRRHEQRFADQGIASFGVCSPEIRLAFWTLQATGLQQFCEGLGIEVLKPPAEALSDGFLRPEYHHGGAHANAAYGELFLQQVEANFT